MHLVSLIQVANVVAASTIPPDRPHLPNLFSSVDGNVDNYTSTVVGTIPKWLKATKFNNGNISPCLSPSITPCLLILICYFFFSVGCDCMSIPPRFPVVPIELCTMFVLSCFRPGFGKFEGDSGFKFKYLFDVMSYVTKWRVDGDTNAVTFSNKFLDSHYYNVSAHKIPPFRTFGGTSPSPPITELPAILTSMLNDNLNVNVQMINGRLFVISDMSGHFEVDPLTLRAIGPLKFDDKMKTKFDVVSCAHPTQLASEPYTYNYYVKVMGGLGPSHMKDLNEWVLYRMRTVDEGGPIMREPIMKLPLADGSVPYMHSFANTPNYLVLFQFPLHWDIAGIMFSETILNEMSWDPKNGTRILVVDKKTGKILQEHYTKATFAYHHVNAFENDTHILVDITTVPCDTSGLDNYPMQDIDVKKLPASCLHMNSFNMDTIKTNAFHVPPNSFERFFVPLPSKSGAAPASKDQGMVPYQKLTNTSFDLAAINPTSRGHPYRYVWGLMTHGEGTWWSSLVKLDLQTGSQIEWYKPDHLASEPNFIPTPGATLEDDGVLLSQVRAPHTHVMFSFHHNAHLLLDPSPGARWPDEQVLPVDAQRQHHGANCHGRCATFPPFCLAWVRGT